MGLSPQCGFNLKPIRIPQRALSHIFIRKFPDCLRSPPRPRRDSCVVEIDDIFIKLEFVSYRSVHLNSKLTRTLEEVQGWEEHDSAMVQEHSGIKGRKYRSEEALKSERFQVQKKSGSLHHLLYLVNMLLLIRDNFFIRHFIIT